MSLLPLHVIILLNAVVEQHLIGKETYGNTGKNIMQFFLQKKCVQSQMVEGVSHKVFTLAPKATAPSATAVPTS